MNRQGGRVVPRRNLYRIRGYLSVPRSTAYRLNARLRNVQVAGAQQQHQEPAPLPQEEEVHHHPEQVDLNVNNEQMDDGGSASEHDEEPDEHRRENDNPAENVNDGDNRVFANILLEEEQGAQEDGGIPILTVGPKNIEGRENLHEHIQMAPNKRQSKFETLLLVLTFAMRHGLTAVAVKDLCEMVNLILGNNAIPSSRYMFKTIFASDMQFQYHLFCSGCVAYMGIITEAMKALKSVRCEMCGKLRDVPGLNGKDFFVTLPVKTQIADLLQNMDDVLEQLNHRWERNQVEDEIGDIFDGEVYRELCTEGKFLSSRYNLSMTFNTDGASVFESGCTTLWPIFFRLNEFTPQIRFDGNNCMIAALWFGSKEPSMAMYFKTFLHECKDLYENGIYWQAPNNEVIHSKVITLSCLLDSSAKPKLQSIKKFNGYQSCPYCDHPGVTFDDNNMCKWPMKDNYILMHDFSFTYSVTQQGRNGRPLSYRVCDRNNETLRQLMDVAHNRRLNEPGFTDWKGVLGRSPMCFLPFFDVCFGFQIDYMHAVLMGTCKHLASLWFDHSETEYCIRGQTNAVEHRLLGFTPPSSISRRPRSISQRADWHANEWRNWLLYYSLPCLKNILPARFYKHHCILVSAIYTLLKETISNQELESATWELGVYVHEFQGLYSPQEMFFNVHLLLHLGKSVAKWGPLYCFSMFSFESANNTVIKLVKGTTGVASQIVSKYSVSKYLPHLMKVYDVGQDVVKFCAELMCYQRFSHSSKVGDIRVVGNQRHAPVPEAERLLLDSNNIDPNGSFYERMIVNKMMFHSRLYSRIGSRSDDSVVHLVDGRYAVIVRILYNRNGDVVLLLRAIRTEAGFITYHECGAKATHIKLCRPVALGNLFVAHAKDVISKSILMALMQTAYISDFPNSIEKD